VDCFASDNKPDGRLDGGSGTAEQKDCFTTWHNFVNPQAVSKIR
jgi:hypothetical protein